MSAMVVVFGVIALVLAAIGVYAAVRALKSPSGAGRSDFAAPGRTDPLDFVSGAGDFGPQVLGPGAVITRNGTDYIVRGSITFRQGPYVWWSHLFDNGETLDVEVDEGILTLIWWRGRKDLYGLTPADSLTVDEVLYRRTEMGDAVYHTEGTTGVAPSGSVKYADYESGSLRLGLENFDGAGWEVSTGETVGPHELTVYPAPRA